MEWLESTLGAICDKGAGVIRTGPFGAQLHQHDYSEEGVPVVMPKDIVSGRISTSSIARISDEHVARLSQHKLHAGDIVYGRRGDIGRCALIREAEAGWLCGTGCLRIALGKGEVLPEYLFYYLSDPSVIAWIFSQAVGATMPNLNTGILRSIPVRYPQCEAYQRHIIAILSAYDDLIENNTRRIEILEEMARRLYEEWFVHFRFPGYEEVYPQSSSIQALPSGWSKKRLVDVARLTMGQSPSSEFYNDLGEGLPFHQGVTDFGALFPKNRLFCSVENRLAHKDDILFSVRAPVGRINVSTEKMVIGRGLSAIRENSNRQRFLLCQLRHLFAVEDLIGSGTIFNSVTKKDMENIELVWPSEKLISSFNNLVDPLFKQIFGLFRKTANLRAQRDLLLPKLISGEIDVSDIPMPN
ncbi:restriction endonuclease subunit S [Pseudomonas defluvii]|uniref:restriction endonuclease subunit S n=1 Tax=Pseudomonas defluvii TaxID=1876757 RepID=UPI0008116168|nr:restriction endonuclease subunit S [Pseudomonas defluvii]